MYTAADYPEIARAYRILFNIEKVRDREGWIAYINVQGAKTLISERVMLEGNRNTEMYSR